MVACSAPGLCVLCGRSSWNSIKTIKENQYHMRILLLYIRTLLSFEMSGTFGKFRIQMVYLGSIFKR